MNFKTTTHTVRNAHQAIKKARQYINEGYTWIVDIDLEKYFDTVNHDKLMSLVAREVKDKRVLKLIRAYLNSGVMINGVIVETDKGCPQGGPLSPLLSNIMLDVLDKDCLLYTSPSPRDRQRSRMPSSA